ncbi:7 transmembrane receptor, partial [Ostertagia ostertagi]
ELQPKVLLVVVVFVLCFVVGVCGNSSILTLIRGVMADRRARTRRQGDNAILYIAALCVCDFLMSLSLPPAILDSVIGFWIFGTWMCKLHHVCGSVGRIVSTFLITAMSFDRYVAICHPHHTYLRSRSFVLGVISCEFQFMKFCNISTFSILYMLQFAKIHRRQVFQFWRSFFFYRCLPTPERREMVLHELKALDSFNITRVSGVFTNGRIGTILLLFRTFILGYVVPLILIVFFNWKLIRKLYVHKRSAIFMPKKRISDRISVVNGYDCRVLPRSSIPLRRVVMYTVLIAAVYFVCWTPYWFSVLYAIVMSLVGLPTTNSELLLFVIYCVHLLPYFGSSSNWILYGLLNTQLQ